MNINLIKEIRAYINRITFSVEQFSCDEENINTLFLRRQRYDTKKNYLEWYRANANIYNMKVVKLLTTDQEWLKHVELFRWCCV